MPRTSARTARASLRPRPRAKQNRDRRWRSQRLAVPSCSPAGDGPTSSCGQTTATGVRPPRRERDLGRPQQELLHRRERPRADRQTAAEQRLGCVDRVLSYCNTVNGRMDWSPAECPRARSPDIEQAVRHAGHTARQARRGRLEVEEKYADAVTVAARRAVRRVRKVDGSRGRDPDASAHGVQIGRAQVRGRGRRRDVRGAGG